MRFDLRNVTNKKKIIYGFVVTIIAILCWRLFGTVTSHEHALKKNPDSTKAVDRPLSKEIHDKTPSNAQILKAPGTVDFHPNLALRLHPPFQGVVTKVYKNLGDRVNLGDPLATIDSNIGIQTNTMTSPIAGIVLAKQVSEGQTVIPEEELFSVGNVSLLRARLAIALRDIKKIKTGQEVTLVAGSLRTVKSSITFISPILDEETRTATAIVDFSSPDFLPGMFVTGSFSIDPANETKNPDE